MISRQHVLNTLAFLIVAMIFINLYTFVLMMSTMAEGANHRFLRRTLKRQHSRNQSDIMPHTEKISDMDLEHEKKSYTTVRFIRRNGRIILYEDPRARPLNPDEQNEVFKAVMRKLDSVRVPPYEDISLTVRILGRVRRAFTWSHSNRENSIYSRDPASVWRQIREWPFDDQVYLDATLGQVLQFASRARILQAKCSRRGTQLKLNLILEGNQVALFKPKWYPRDFVVDGDVYGGKDRHFGEIAAFYLSQILGYNNSPLTVGRKLNLREEIMPVSTTQLRNTFYYDKGGNHCFYGVCYYCSPKDPVCAEAEELEGAIVLMMNQKMVTVPNPWARTYKTDEFAAWQTNMSFCSNLDLRKIDPQFREEFVLDMVAVAVFDFLIGNGDRHHFDVLNDTDPSMNSYHSRKILLIDNGKSFGNPYEDYLDILAPLYQCCRLRKSLWDTLKEFQHTDLGNAVDSLSKADPLYPLLTPEHLSAINVRLKIVIAVVDYCLDTHPHESVIIT